MLNLLPVCRCLTRPRRIFIQDWAATISFNHCVQIVLIFNVPNNIILFKCLNDSHHRDNILFTGPSSYKQHGYRVLRIWVDSLGPDLDPIEELIDSLNTIEKNSLAGNIIFTYRYPSHIRKTYYQV